ncbi:MULTISPECIES: hypothetical protein [Butyricimonas]|uniref:hypothetical protein n=1 Tax=Butyricimonas TaxID=574697 RepID=UPI0007FB1F18|nr:MULTISPECIES: hypothetical protein [Butyricimonas]
MDKGLFHELYKQLYNLDIRSYPPEMLSGLLHGYLTVYSMVRVYPWLESDFGNPYDVHERAKEIARLYSEQLANEDLPVDSRAGYAADMMDVYQLYSDLSYLNNGLDAAYRILTARGSDKIVLPCRTPNVCRLLCNCYYFANDKMCGELAGRLVTEALGYIRGGDQEVLLSWWDAFCLYGDVVGAMMLPGEDNKWQEKERACLRVSVGWEEDKRIERFRQMGLDTDFCLVAEVFKVLAKRVFDELNRLYR